MKKVYNTTNSRLLLLKIKRLNQFKEVAKCIKLVSFSAIHSFKSVLKNRFNSLFLAKLLFDVDNILFLDNTTSEKFLFLVSTANKSSCGALNNQIVKTVIHFVETYKVDNKQVKIIFLGKKGYTILKSKYISDIQILINNFEKEIKCFTFAYIITNLLNQLNFDKYPRYLQLEFLNIKFSFIFAPQITF